MNQMKFQARIYGKFKFQKFLNCEFMKKELSKHLKSFQIFEKTFEKFSSIQNNISNGFNYFLI